ncbi:26S proteasome non-ATPase regulatory subunit 10 [Coniosporium apollinis CBS 100218]|uniref:26S proteasome non-ATPase regulatory subunit 10 n=1 Tax=Coniosporium apollinis (strain CBS 100218) TaxID=1168221 RepID=R7YHW8_CONA1|nr:26S proteasome non-ATPase regulatory subunit 10 [Coniosporium apollinis CBS 100218]EON61497.1 26S proteasome non-ATPase regulatory subunit 10 [Coniosporium apollinis CBS 100218]
MDSQNKDRYEIHEAAREGKTSVVESLLNANPRLSSRRDEDDRLPLHWAVSYNRPEIVQLLMQSKNFDVDAQDGLGWTPLMMASSLRAGDGDALIDTLLSAGADVNAKNNNGQTALHFAASKNNIDTARKLTAHKASARVKDKRGQLALHRAAAVGSVPMMKLLLENKSPVNATDVDGMTALHHAISEGHGDAAMMLLKAGAETDKRDTDGHLAIQLAPDAKIRDFILQSAEREGIDLEQ